MRKAITICALVSALLGTSCPTSNLNSPTNEINQQRNLTFPEILAITGNTLKDIKLESVIPPKRIDLENFGNLTTIPKKLGGDIFTEVRLFYIEEPHKVDYLVFFNGENVSMYGINKNSEYYDYISEEFERRIAQGYE